MKRWGALLIAATLALVEQPTVGQAINVTGGVDPTTGLQTLATWIFTLVGVAIPTICAFKGAHAVAEGRHLMPYVGSAIGGSVLAFGGAYLLQHYGVS
jgi:hypothetical protein